MRGAIAIAALLAMPSAACSSCSKDEGPPTAIEPGPPDGAALKGSPQTIDFMAGALGSQPLVPRLEDGGAKDDLVLFSVPGADARDLVNKHFIDAREQGAYLFLFQPGMDGQQALLGLAPTRDPFEVVHIVGTRATNPPHDNVEILRWLLDLHRTQPLAISGAGIAFIEGAFLAPVKDPAAIAAKVDAFCPDFGKELADEKQGDTKAWFTRNTHFLFTWD